MKKNIIILPGDGIGPEVVDQALRVIDAVNESFGHTFVLNKELIGAASIDAFGLPLTNEVIEKCKKSDAILLGAIGHPKYDNDFTTLIRPEQGLLKLRKALSLYANIRPIHVYEISKNASPLKEEIINGVDLLLFRELTGGLYFGEKYISEDGNTAQDTCIYTRKEIYRISKLAFDCAMTRKKKLLLVDKANVLESSRLWRKVVQEMSEIYPDVSVEYMYIDNAAMQLMINPRKFDVVLTENLFGDILSDQASVITGSIGLLPSSSVGSNTALFEPIHGSYPQESGKDIANPFATILSVAMMYEYFNLHQESAMIRRSVAWAMKNNLVTRDLNENEYFFCSQVGEYISTFIELKGDFKLNKTNISNLNIFL